MELVAAMGTKLKPDFGAQRTTPKNNFFASLCYFAQLLNSHFVWPAIDFHYFPPLFSIYRLCESLLPNDLATETATS